MRNFILSILGACFLSSCVSTGQPLTLDQKATIVKSAARTAVVFGIKEGYKNDIPRQRQAARDLHNIVGSQLVPIFKGTNPVAVDLPKLLSDKVPVQYLLLIQSGIDILSIYYRPVAVGEVLDADSLKLINSFLIGLLDGCSLILSTTA